MMGLHEQSFNDLMRIALDLKGLGSFENAREVLEHLASEYPQESGVFILLGIVYERMNAEFNAKDAYLRALKLEPDLPLVHASLAILVFWSDPDLAVKHLERAKELSDGEQYARFSDLLKMMKEAASIINGNHSTCIACECTEDWD
jgi:Flp pilus assembly protein TadD